MKIKYSGLFVPVFFEPGKIRYLLPADGTIHI